MLKTIMKYEKPKQIYIHKFKNKKSDIKTLVQVVMIS